uniref:Jasmonate O-methyltransferase n=1 Tax=Leersia perrieri TaxID=77586 RepID=A0A0D9WPR6_9ORYZ
MASEQNHLYMNPGQDKTSYARNSTLQKTEQDRMKPLIEDAITALCRVAAPQSMAIMDLGCSSGPNALTLTSATVDAIHRHCMKYAQTAPEICLFLNDLPYNDFNTVAKSLAEFKHCHDRSSHHVIVAGMIPGSFYERLVTSGSVHFVCSSYSLHWLSKAPEELAKRKIPMYDSDEHSRLLNSEIVANAYARQFRKDFTLFLSLRAEELVLGGRLVFSLLGRCSSNPASVCTQAWKLVAIALNDMALRVSLAYIE